jgi:hypothetical protein
MTHWRSVAYGKRPYFARDFYIAVCDDGKSVMSEDGISWTQGILGKTTNMFDVA